MCTIRRLAELAPTTLAIVHGWSFSGDGAAALHDLGGCYATCSTPNAPQLPGPRDRFHGSVG